MSLVLDSVFMPFHAADDEDHFASAYAASHMRFGPVPSPDPRISSGNYLDAAIPVVVARNFDAARLSAKPKAGETRWSGERVFAPLPASVYLPLAYLPQMLAIRICEEMGLTVETTIHAARIANGLTALAIIAIAIGFLPETIGVFVLLLLSLPKSLQVFASNSADPMNHAIAIALVAFFCQAVTTNWRPGPWHYAAAGMGCIVLGGIRPPLAAIGLLVFYVAFRRRNYGGMMIAGSAMALALAWWAYVLPIFHDARCPASGGLGQMLSLFAENGPWLIGRTVAEHGTYYWGTFIGELGYGDARIDFLHPLPMWIYVSATIILVLGAMAMGDEKLRVERTTAAVPVIVSCIISTGIFVSLSFACTAAGSSTIGGVQGRYFVTPILLLTIPAAVLLPRMEMASRLVRLTLPAFLVANFTVMVVAGIELYWGWDV